LVSAFILADGLVKGHRTTVDTKVHALDIFDDLCTQDQHRLIRRQLKSGDPGKRLQLSYLKTQQSETRIDQLIRSFKGDPVPASEYRLCVTWKVDHADPIMEFLSPCQVESTFSPHRGNPDTGKPFWPGRIQENRLVPAAKKAGLGRIGWHTFRHSHSSLLHALGVDLKVQQELLRHADIRTTMNIYTHAVPAALRKANSKVVRLVLPAQVA
jgi:hypothetical protein